MSVPMRYTRTSGTTEETRWIISRAWRLDREPRMRDLLLEA